MRIACVMIVLLAAAVDHCHAGSPATQAMPTTQATTGPVAAVWFEPSGMRILKPGEKIERHRLIVGVWGDGTVVWSDDRATGGAPYRTARVDPAVVADLEQSLAAAELFEPINGVQFGPDASITVLAAEVGGKRQWLGTWHEPPRDNPQIVIDQRGIYAIKAGERPPEPSPEYARFRKVWSESRRLIESVVPKEGQPASNVDERIFELGRRRGKATSASAPTTRKAATTTKAASAGRTRAAPASSGAAAP